MSGKTYPTTRHFLRRRARARAQQLQNQLPPHSRYAYRVVKLRSGLYRYKVEAVITRKSRKAAT